ncbi:MAG: transposase [Gammaproteobacteria bacterium]|nr:transposase [Gammaproteobacteria bacterium]MBL4882790.1 transposase [Oleispira sp.]
MVRYPARGQPPRFTLRELNPQRLNIDNNRAEGAIKPFVIRRKNWMFSNIAKGAQASAVLYSVIETAKSMV